MVKKPLLLLLLCTLATSAGAYTCHGAPPSSAAGAGLQEEEPDPAAGSRPGEEGRAFVEIAVSREACFVQEPVALRLRFGFHAPFFRDRVIQPFQRRLDVPLQIRADWIDGLPGTMPLQEDQARAGSSEEKERWSFALNDGVAEATRFEDRIIEGRTFVVLEIERSYLPLSPGSIEIPAPRLSFSFTSHFRDDLISGRVPADRHEVSFTGRSLSLAIAPLPLAGRPPEFAGAVGRFTVEAEIDRAVVKLGETLRLSLHIEGQGNLHSFAPPVPAALAGFHIFGSMDEKNAKRRTITLDLAPLGKEVSLIPAIPFAFFDTTRPARYRTLFTRPIAIRVAAPSPGDSVESWWSTLSGHLQPGKTDIHRLKPVLLPAEIDDLRPPPFLLLGMLLPPWILAFGLLWWLRAIERDRNDPAGVRARRAAAAFRRDIARQGADLGSALAEYLGARLRCPAAAMIAPELPVRLADAGLPRGLSERSAFMITELTEARFGGRAASIDCDAAGALVLELEQHFLGEEERR